MAQATPITHTDKTGRAYFLGYVDGDECQFQTKHGKIVDFGGWYFSYVGSIDSPSDVFHKVSTDFEWVKTNVFGPFATESDAHDYANNLAGEPSIWG